MQPAISAQLQADFKPTRHSTMSSPEPHSSSTTGDRFPDSRWSLIGKFQKGSETVAREALDTLCRIYWYPIYGYIRHVSGRPEEAQDLTQGYFLHLLQRDYINHASQEKGKFRAFLLADVKLYLANERRSANSEKRGGKVQIVPIQVDWAEERYGHEPVDNVTPDQLYDRQWALTLLARVMESLRGEYEKKERLPLFEALKQFISWNAGDESYSQAAVKLGRDENYVKQNVYRMRQSYRKLLEAEVGHTVASPEEVAAEIRHLAASLC